jgi:hypothetical protein
MTADHNLAAVLSDPDREPSLDAVQRLGDQG